MERLLATRVDRWVLKKTIKALSELPCLTGVERLWINLPGQSVGYREFHLDPIQQFKEAGDEVC